MIPALVRSARGRSARSAALMAAVITASVAWGLNPLVRSLDAAVIADTPAWYLEMAVNLAWCGRYPYMTSTVGDNRSRVDLLNVRVADAGPRTLHSLVSGGTGSLAGYCRMQGEYAPVHESSMVLVESALLAFLPGITTNGIAYGLSSLAALGFAAFAFVLLSLRWPVLFVAAIVASGIYMTSLLGGSALYSPYPLILPATLAGIGAGALCLAYGVHLKPWAFPAAVFALGVWAGFLGNLRTSLYPTAVLIALLLIGLAAWDQRTLSRWPRRRVATLAGGAFIALLAGILTFDRLWIAPVRAAVGTNYSYHVIAHPLVLGLATPPSELATRENIQWSDASGAEAARKIDPEVRYLGPGYERALFRYYNGLWKDYPREMAGIYLRKLAVTRANAEEFLASTRPGLFWTSKDGRWLTIAAWPALRAAGAIGVTGLFAALLAIAVLRPAALEMDRARGFCLAGVAIAGFMGFIESAVVLSGVVLWYSTVYVFALIFAGLYLYQTAIDSAWRVAAPPVREVK